MLFLCLAVLSSATISILMRLSANKVTGNLSMLCFNYLACTLLSAVYAGFDVFCFAAPGYSTTLWLGVLGGVLFLGGFVLFQWNTARCGIVLTSIFMKLGLLVPMALSVFLFRELPSWTQVAGFCIALLAIVLINLKSSTSGKPVGWLLLLQLLLCGGADAMSKVYEVWGAPGLSNQFLFYTFAVALMLCVGCAVRKKERPGLRELVFGMLIGIPNFFSSKFLLLALTELPAVVVFPSFSVATMLIVTLTGVFFFKERLQKRQWIALGGILCALALLNI